MASFVSEGNDSLSVITDDQTDLLTLIHGNIYLLPENFDNQYSIKTSLLSVSTLSIEENNVFKNKHKPTCKSLTGNIFKILTNLTNFHPQGKIDLLFFVMLVNILIRRRAT